MAVKSIGQQCVNVATGKTSYIEIQASGGVSFPDPTLNAYGATVIDGNNGFNYSPAVAVPQGPPYPASVLALKITSNMPGGGGVPTQGLLSITLTITPNNGGPSSSPPVADMPVNYISDPNGP
jgi:hypothetical protein